MKKAYLKDLQAKLLGSATSSSDVLDHFSTDGSIFQARPEAVVYPHNTADVRKTVQFAVEHTIAGHPMNVIARGKGTDQGGGAVGEGIHLVFPAHMNQIIKLDKDSVTVQPGILYKSLQQTLQTHERFLPPYPASIDYCTIGGAVANNASGEKTVKYGSTRNFVKSLRVVLSDGSLIETHRISGRELNRKKGLTTLEGTIYRKLDSILLDNAELIRKSTLKTTKNTSGYNLADIRGKDGSFDLSQIFIGSQGTLGVITEVTLKTAPYTSRTVLVTAGFNSITKAGEAITKLLKLTPSALELVDEHLLKHIKEQRPADLESLGIDPLPKILLLIEFDEVSQLTQRIKSSRAVRLIGKLGGSVKVAADPIEQAALWKIRRSAAAVIALEEGSKKALPFIEDGIVPQAKLSIFLEKTYKLLEKYNLDIAVWGHAGDANLHLQPYLDLSRKKDRDKLLHLSKEFFEMVIALGGSPAAEHNDGLLRSLYLKTLYGDEVVKLFEEVKDIFDPYAVLNPHQKTNVTEEYMQTHLRSEYSLPHLYDHLPHL